MKMSTTPFGSVQSHGIDDMGDCMQSVPVEEYKKSHPLFINKISDADITREDIAQMNPDLFAVYEREIDNRLASNKIGNSRSQYSQNSVEKTEKSVSKSSADKRSGDSSEGKWVTINGNHVLIKD